jgi:hypothetical protein
MSFRKLVFACGLIGLSATALAQEEVIGDDGYNKTYNDDSKSFKDRMKQARTVPVVTVDNTNGGITLGGIAGFGPVYDAEPGSTSGMGFSLGVEAGYVLQGDSWSRLEFGIDVAKHSMTWKRNKNTTATLEPFSVMPKVGFGHNLGDNMFGIIRLGFGFAPGEMTLKSGGVESKTDSKTGLMLAGSYDVTYGQGLLQFLGGMGVEHFRYAFSETTTGGRTDSSDLGLDLNSIKLHLGARLKF